MTSTHFASFGTFLPSGDLWTRLQRNFSRLEEEKYWPANVYQREKEFENWPGDTEGRTLLAWVLLAQATGRAPRYVEGMLARWAEEVNGKGYFGKIYTDGISEQQLSSHGWVLRALAELEHWQPGGPARALASPILEHLFLPVTGQYAIYPINPGDREGAGAYSGTHHKQIGQWILSTDIGCYVIGMDGVIDAYAAFRDERLVPLINEMVDRFLEIDLATIQAQTHATLTACRGLLRWATLNNRPELITAAEERYCVYTALAWTESYANYNWFNRPRWTEPCAMVDSLIVAMELWRHTGKTRYLSEAQLIWFNALGHGQRANGGFGCDNCPGADGTPDLVYSNYEAHWCCTMRGGEGLARMTQYQVARDGDAVVLPFLLPGDFMEPGGMHLSIQSAYPLDAAATISLDGNLSGVTQLRVFMPEWITGLKTSVGVRNGDWLEIPVRGPLELKITGKLVERARELLPATQAFMIKGGTKISNGGSRIYMRGPLILATKPGDTASNNLVPIFQAYLDGVTEKERSSRRLIFPPVTAPKG